MSPVDPSPVPFWRLNIMYAESVVFIAGDSGPPKANLLFAPDTVSAVTSAAGDISYSEGVDYELDRHAGTMIRTAGSRIPETRREDLAAAGGGLTHGRTVAVTYTHSADLQHWQPGESAGALARVSRRLQRRESLTICLTGDSISEGYDSSGFHGIPPYQPAFGPLVATALSQEYAAPVHLHNQAVAGSTAADGVWNTSAIAALKPDLVMIAFGMNDACYAEAAEYATNVSAILARLQERVEKVEFLLISPMLPTDECTWLVPERFDQYRAGLRELTGEGILLADVTGLWTRIVARKDPHDVSGNGLNHPNDFGHRLYAQTIFDLLGR